MAKLFRIVKHGDFFIVQEKFLWFWRTKREVSHDLGPSSPGASVIIRFKSIKLAREFILGSLESIDYKNATVEYHKIVGSIAYSSKNEF